MRSLGKTSYNAQTCQSGYTLIEMLVVMSLLSLLLGIGFKTHNFLQDLRLQQVAEEIKYFIETGKQMSILSNINYTISCDSTEGLHYIGGSLFVTEVDKYWVPSDMEVGIGTQKEIIKPENALPNFKKIRFAGDMSAYETGTLRLRYKGGTHLIEIVTQPITGYVTISTIY